MKLLFLTRFIQSHTKHYRRLCSARCIRNKCTQNVSTLNSYSVCLLKQRYSIPSQAFSTCFARYFCIVWKNLYRSLPFRSFLFCSGKILYSVNIFGVKYEWKWSVFDLDYMGLNSVMLNRCWRYTEKDSEEDNVCHAIQWIRLVPCLTSFSFPSTPVVVIGYIVQQHSISHRFSTIVSLTNTQKKIPYNNKTIAPQITLTHLWVFGIHLSLVLFKPYTAKQWKKNNHFRITRVIELTEVNQNSLLRCRGVRIEVMSEWHQKRLLMSTCF